MGFYTLDATIKEQTHKFLDVQLGNTIETSRYVLMYIYRVPMYLYQM